MSAGLHALSDDANMLIYSRNVMFTIVVKHQHRTQLRLLGMPLALLINRSVGQLKILTQGQYKMKKRVEEVKLQHHSSCKERLYCQISVFGLVVFIWVITKVITFHPQADMNVCTSSRAVLTLTVNSDLVLDIVLKCHFVLVIFQSPELFLFKSSFS